MDNVLSSASVGLEKALLGPLLALRRHRWLPPKTILHEPLVMGILRKSEATREDRADDRYKLRSGRTCRRSRRGVRMPRRARRSFRTRTGKT